MKDNYVTLYDDDGKPTVGVELSDEGMAYYQAGGRDLSTPGYVVLMLDLERIALADFR